MMDTREIYFDNSATTRCSREVCDAVMDAMRENYGNPSSRHLKGVEAERILRQAREEIASTLRCSEKEIFFTSGGTESDNWAVIGGASANKRSGMHLITTAVEHPAVVDGNASVGFFFFLVIDRIVERMPDIGFRLAEAGRE